MSAKLTLDDRAKLDSILLVNKEQFEALSDLLDSVTLSEYAVDKINDALYRCSLIQSFVKQIHDPT